MNQDNLHELIRRYQAKMPLLYDENSHDELFKWRAMLTWQESWFGSRYGYKNFIDRFNASCKDFGVLVDNARMHPTNGVNKLWEVEPETVEHLFCDVLFADPQGDIQTVQKNMDAFLAGYDELLQRHYPTNWSFKQDRHSSSVYLAMMDPKLNYIFKSSEAQTMAKYIDFGINIGSGANFSLPNYYKLCDAIVDAMYEHEGFWEAHEKYLDNRHYDDKNLHLLAFDLMYCCRTYGYYRGLTVSSTGKTIKKAAVTALTPEERAYLEEERLRKISAMEEEINELERSCDGCEDISLLGVQVTSPQFGSGKIIEQDLNRIKVAFPDSVKPFILDKKFPARPRFENDEEIVSAFTVYGRAQERIAFLQKQIESLQK